MIAFESYSIRGEKMDSFLLVKAAFVFLVKGARRALRYCSLLKEIMGSYIHFFRIIFPLPSNQNLHSNILRSTSSLALMNQLNRDLYISVG